MPASIVCTSRTTCELAPLAPFDFDSTFHKPDHFPSNDNRWVPGIRWQTMIWQALPLGLKFENCGSLDQPRVALTIWSLEPLASAYIASLRTEIVFRYNLALDLNPFYRQFAADPLLGPVCARWRGLRPSSHSSLYEYLIIAIVLQNATVRRSVQMLRNLFDHYGAGLAYDGQQLFCFWQPEALAHASETELRDLKVGYRAKSLLRVSQAFANDGMDEFVLRSLPRQQQRQALLDLYGIGPASVEYILFDVFHHFDRLDHISPWEQKIYSRLFFGVDPATPISAAELQRFFEARFGNYQALAVHYLWEDLFWQRQNRPVPWLEELIRL